MARGDVVQLNHTVNASGAQTITPASGVSYLIMRLSFASRYFSLSFLRNGSTINWENIRASYFDYGSYVEPSPNPFEAGFCVKDVKWYIDNTHPLKVYRNSTDFWHLTAVILND